MIPRVFYSIVFMFLYMCLFAYFIFVVNIFLRYFLESIGCITMIYIVTRLGRFRDLIYIEKYVIKTTV